MSSGYIIEWLDHRDRYGRPLINITLSDGRDAGDALLSEGFAQHWPNRRDVWCNGSGEPSVLIRWPAALRNWARTMWHRSSMWTDIELQERQRE